MGVAVAALLITGPGWSEVVAAVKRQVEAMS